MSDAERTAEEIRSRLKAQGWCLLTCESLGNETIALMRDKPPLRDFERIRLEEQAKKAKEKSGSNNDIVCYTLSEFLMLRNNSSPRLIHETKRLGATVRTDED